MIPLLCRLGIHKEKTLFDGSIEWSFENRVKVKHCQRCSRYTSTHHIEYTIRGGEPYLARNFLPKHVNSTTAKRIIYIATEECNFATDMKNAINKGRQAKLKKIDAKIQAFSEKKAEIKTKGG